MAKEKRLRSSRFSLYVATKIYKKKWLFFIKFGQHFRQNSSILSQQKP